MGCFFPLSVLSGASRVLCPSIHAHVSVCTQALPSSVRPRPFTVALTLGGARAVLSDLYFGTVGLGLEFRLDQFLDGTLRQ